MHFGTHKKHKHRSSGGGGNKNQWMLTFADLLSLILTFFVMLYAMSVLQQQEQWQKVTYSLSQHLNPNIISEEPRPSEQLTINKIEIPLAKDLDYLHTILKEKVGDTLINGTAIKLHRTDTQLVISLPSDEAFGKGSATLNPESVGTLALIGDMVGTIGNAVDVVGYSDPSPTSSVLFPSNWELSLSRALTVANYVKGCGYMYGINSYGRAASTYDLLSPETSKEEKYNFLRRVDIVIKAEMVQP